MSDVCQSICHGNHCQRTDIVSPLIHFSYIEFGHGCLINVYVDVVLFVYVYLQKFLQINTSVSICFSIMRYEQQSSKSKLSINATNMQYVYKGYGVDINDILRNSPCSCLIKSMGIFGNISNVTQSIFTVYCHTLWFQTHKLLSS